MDVRVEVKDSYRTGREDGMQYQKKKKKKRCPNQSRRRCRRRDAAVGCLVRYALVPDVLLLEHTLVDTGACDSASCRTRLGGGDQRGWRPILSLKVNTFILN